MGLLVAGALYRGLRREVEHFGSTCVKGEPNQTKGVSLPCTN